MSLFYFPFFRKSIPSVGNPAFIDDILASNQLTIDGLTALTGLTNPGFAIISGLNYTAGSPGVFSPGTFWLNGFFYVMQTSFSEGQYLAPNLTDVNSEPFSDITARMTYTEYFAAATGSPTGATPLFSGNMNAYRISLSQLNTFIQALQTTAASLGSAAFLNVGTTAGTVAAGNDSRFGYTVAQINSLFALIADVLIMGSTNGNFVPTQPYDPATKQYVDNSSAGKLGFGNYNIGTLTSGGQIVNISFGETLANTAYQIMLTPVCTDGTFRQGCVTAMCLIKSTTGCTIQVYTDISIFQDVSIDWMLFEN